MRFIFFHECLIARLTISLLWFAGVDVMDKPLSSTWYLTSLELMDTSLLDEVSIISRGRFLPAVLKDLLSREDIFIVGESLVILFFMIGRSDVINFLRAGVGQTRVIDDVERCDVAALELTLPGYAGVSGFPSNFGSSEA